MTNTRSSGVKKEFDRMIREAEIMMRGTDLDQRERGREKLREVARQAEGSIYAQRALELLAAAEPRSQESLDPELDELMRLWPSMQGFNDFRLGGFLRRLASYQKGAPLRAEVVREVQSWIVDELPGVGTEMNLRKTEALNEFVAAVRGVAAFEELPEFGQLRDRLFQKRLEETTTRIYSALAAWELEEAQRAMSDLTPFPDAFKVNEERLQAEIDEVDSLRRTVDRLLRHLPDRPPANWFEARLQVELQEQLQQCQTNNRVPKEWRLRLDEAVTGLAEFVCQFTRGQAQAAVTISLLRCFWTKFQRLQGHDAAPRAEISEDWFAAVADSLMSAVHKEVERASNADELMSVANRLRVDAEGIPPTIASRLIALADDVTRTSATWRAMEEGRSFALAREGSGVSPLPNALAAESEPYAVWLEQIEAALNSFVNETSLQLEQDYADRLQLAESVLASVPHHVLALKLKQEATRRLTCYQLDQSLLTWNVELLFELLESDRTSEIYNALTDSKPVLIQLRDLTQQPPLKNWRSASDWWVRWQAALKLLPASKPDALTTALDQHAAKRQLERYATFDRLLQDNLAPREYQDAASSLNQESDSSLRSYRQELLRRAAIGHIEEHIRNGRVEDAARELGNLPPTSTDAMRLRTLLEVEQVRGRSSVAAAEYLFDKWENVRAYVNQPEQLLLETITAVWTEEQQGAIFKMSRLISRLLRESTETQLTQRLTEWQTWIEIEDGLIRQFSSGGVKQLSDYLRGAESSDLLDLRLKRILRHWQSESNTVMLAWAHQAFRRVSTVAHQCDEAAEDLVRESDQIASDVQRVLADSATLTLDDLKPLHSALQREEERWRSLDDFLTLLPYSVEHPQPSAKLSGATQRLSEMLRILTSLDHLKEADLRQALMAQNYDDAYSRALRLRNIGSRTNILEQLERWRPLREELFSLEQRIRETAERCRSKEVLNVLEPSLFEQLAGYVRKVVEVFDTAGARGGGMWMLVSAEYELNIYREACVLLPVTGSCPLDQLVSLLEDLHAEELSFTQALTLLEDRDRQPKIAWGGAFDPPTHLEYLALIPQQEPRSLKVYHRFERAHRDTLKLVLEAPESRPHLPVWVLNYLDNGVPVCASGR